MSVYVKNGTPPNGPSLCETCSYGHIRLGYRLGEEVVLCRITDPTSRVTFRVRECTSYIDKTRQSMYEMERVAWSIAPDRTKRTTGFVIGRESDDGESVELILNDEE